ncbi:MAG: aerobic carbon-monoxide dehydrogenase medium subunit [Pseudonocardiales bacterium]|nr:aerobic carbon-monoxide dehydrogenase medium subunit [Pseudonocardiales bacterium]
MLPAFALIRPRSLSEALSAISDDDVPYSGGTELLLAMRAGLQRPRALVDLKAVPELRRIALLDGGAEGTELRIGATTTHDELARDAVVRDSFPMLARVAAGVGNARVRAQGTVGGNLCFAEPRSDLVPALAALDASVVLIGPGGSRRVPVAEFILGMYWTVREPDELMVEVRVPVRPVRAHYVNLRITERPSVGVAIRVDADGRCRLVIGSVGEQPLVLDYDGMHEVDPDAVSAAVEPVPDLTGAEDYKRHLVAVMIRRAMAELETGKKQ